MGKPSDKYRNYDRVGTSVVVPWDDYIEMRDLIDATASSTSDEVARLSEALGEAADQLHRVGQRLFDGGDCFLASACADERNKIDLLTGTKRESTQNEEMPRNY